MPDPTSRSPLLDLPGAVPADAPDEGVAAHYGNPHAEQRALAGGTGYVDLSHRGVVRISGRERLSWLHSLLTQHLSELPPHTPTEALLLDPQGRVQHALYLVDDGEATWAHVEPGAAPELVAYLTKMRFLLDVDPQDVTADYAIVHEAGEHGITDDNPGTPEVLVRAPVLFADAVPGRELFLPRHALAEYAKTHDKPAGIWAYEALRIASHRPRAGLETDERAIPHELDWIGSAVHLDKGCYRGQETVARVENLGHPPRRLVFLHLDGTPEHLPAPGDPVEHDGRTIGAVTSSARHYELGPIALALVKRTVPVDAPLFAGGVAAAQEVVVSPEAGGNARERLRDR
ncbi:MAG TPA: glycine cleavage T C-terminal barrel domain-containing protein [Actinocrinis sp.]|uniref:CAF17-like 4Fe-4S cluster assembly/insertion protein YgfZ n=1 Tax=Actinocrinis sp. TaxID=1920516 RepID=UPI002DDDADEA|nr:glycine cleavage T C-terminal barrel domain-containing protein [Actinocrinis sp.]HEV2346578.1 glycine cleavage T C-terminal barrel domain-containing protein [Actinocrinis sp.]